MNAFSASYIGVWHIFSLYFSASSREGYMVNLWKGYLGSLVYRINETSIQPTKCVILRSTSYCWLYLLYTYTKKSMVHEKSFSGVFRKTFHYLEQSELCFLANRTNIFTVFEISCLIYIRIFSHIYIYVDTFVYSSILVTYSAA